MWKQPWDVIKSFLSLSWLPLMGTPDKQRNLFFSASMPVEQVNIYSKQIHDESFLGIIQVFILSWPRIWPERITTTPILVLGGQDDKSIPLSQLKTIAQTYNTKAIVFPNMARDLMLEAGWQDVCDKMIEWIRIGYPMPY